MSNFDVDLATILKVKHGSHAYGTNIATSDLDIKGVCIQPISHQLGFLHNFEQREQLVSKGHPHDETIFSLKKFASLAANCNPNVLEILFVDESDILECGIPGWELLQNRDLFVTKRARHTFSGYAHAQLKRIKTHRAWLLNPPKAPPDRNDFGLQGERVVGKDEMGAFNAMEKEGLEVPASVLTLLLRERQYQAAKTHWDQYQNWVKTRNPDRAALEAKYGYDTKHGMHLIRLMMMCLEILMGDGVIVKRPDAKFLLGIRDGGISYDTLIQMAKNLDNRCEAMYATSTLPNEPDRVAINDLVVRLTLDYGL